MFSVLSFLSFKAGAHMVRPEPCTVTCFGLTPQRLAAYIMRPRPLILKAPWLWPGASPRTSAAAGGVRPSCVAKAHLSSHLFAHGDCWGVFILLQQLSMVTQWRLSPHILQSLGMAHPGQASCLQGHLSVSCGALAGKDWGNGSGWQQSRQNSALLAVAPGL